MIIATKLHIPRMRSALIARPRLIQRLNEGLNCKLTLVTAPAGYGKTTLLSEWSTMMETPVAWISLDVGDNDRTRFWGHTIEALKQTCSDFDEQKVLHFSTADASGDSLIAAFINELHRVSQTLVLVWDDFHHIEESSIMRNISYLLERLPSHVHLYIASRVTPTLPLSKIHAGNGLIRLDANDLRFTAGETEQFFKYCSSLNLSSEETSVVQDRTEGWIAGMRLVVLSLKGKDDRLAVVQKIVGTERDISDYFFEEVFSQQSAEVQQFLLRTSILERMNGDLCEVVTNKADSEAILNELEQAALFLVPLDNQQAWYRYHHLFQQYLVEQLRRAYPEQTSELHILAAQWFEEKGHARDAIGHYLAGSSYEPALHLLEMITPQLIKNEWSTLHTWLSAIPNALLFTKPMMYLTKLVSLYLSNRIEESTDGYWWAVHKLEETDTYLQPEELEQFRAGLLLLVAYRTYMERDFEYVVEYSQAYVQSHPEGDFFIGFGNEQDGYHPIWDIHVSDSSLNLAEQVLTSLLLIWSKTPNVYFYSHLCIDYGKLLYERNHLEEAEKYMNEALHLGKLHNNASLTVIATLWLARIAFARGKWGNADTMVQNLTIVIEATTSPNLQRKIAWLQALQERMKGETELVAAWVRNSRLQASDEIPPTMIEEYELLACLIAEQGEINEANFLIERLFLLANEAKRQSDVIRLLTHQSRFFSLQGDVMQSMNTLEEALSLAYPEGYMRVFIDEGTMLGQLLDQYIKFRQSQHRRSVKKVPLAYVKRLRRMIYLQRNYNEASAKAGGPIFELTAKEQLVLQLMETGISNKEIAMKLDISLSTVKTHINNIYGKMQVSSRLQAVEHAKRLCLL